MSSVNWKKIYIWFFISFILFSTIYCGVSRVNLLFHVALSLFLLSFIFSPVVRENVLSDRQYLPAMLLVALFAIYYSLSNLWADHSHLESSLTHSFYLLVLMALYRQAELAGYKKVVIAAAWLGTIALAILTLIYVDKTKIFTQRLSNAFPWAPDNVIDLGGYMALGILFSTLLVREMKTFWVLLPVPLLLLCLILTQSRGPMLALVLAGVMVYLLRPNLNLKFLLGLILLLVVVAATLYFSGFLDRFLQRIESSYQQSFIRFGIWQHAFEVSLEKPFFGWGFDKELTFINSINQPVTTTHSLYFSALLKGGFVGFTLFMAMIGFSLWQCKKHLAANHKAEIAILLFALIFYSTQGMFIISNPREYWVLFWLPLIIALSVPPKRQEQ
ncbi:O-antigen ligase family protein [Trabulsiella odontotermitis]|uniref:Polymer ligase n=1 Tax=Trabulsiella odontotermitis TaxID=379893 RepID=A0A0L0H118_9ENTR|nr:O-antigen ligase family protein [Trabulsiella odontotermitis]KNC95140.1 polymer ligase [Trabulsiella odontotermitis]